jgi:hypothetical protein
MPQKRQAGYLEGLVSEIVRQAGVARAPITPRDAVRSLSAAARCDYASALRKHFDRQQLAEILAELREVLPNLNRQVFATTDLRRLRKVAEGLGADLKPDTFEGREGRALRGFYVDRGELLKRPLICVNTANHPVAVAAAFWHEVGHHLAGRIYDQHDQQQNLSFSTEYQSHLTSGQEIAADIVMVLGGYPRANAQRLFGDQESVIGRRDIDVLVARARRHLRSISGFEFEPHFSVNENLNYLAGIVHVAKMRAALLAEYSI